MPNTEAIALLQGQLAKQKSDLTLHIVEFNEHVSDEHKRWDHFIQVQEENTRVNHELAVTMSAQVCATKDMIEAWNATTGAIKVGRVLGKFVKWASGLAFIGVGVLWVVDKFGS
jgi:hypothetical protein